MSGQTPTKRHSKPRALRAVEVHPGRKCSSECKLCGEPSIRYIHVLNWKSSEVAHLQKWAPDVSHWDCICRNCGEEFKRNASKDEYISRWVHKTEPKVSLALKCALEDCQSKQGVKLCSMGSSEQLAELLHCNIVETQSKNEIPLCSVHYNEFFRALNPQKCASCGLKPTRGKQINRHPPNPQLLSSNFISTGKDYHGTLSDVTPETESSGFLSFVRLIGTVYFKLNVASFSHRTPQADFNSLTRVPHALANSTTYAG